MIKTIATAVTILSIASSAMAADVIQTIAFGGSNGGGTGITIYGDNSARGFQQCKSDLETKVREYIREYDANVISRESTSGQTTNGNGTWLAYDVVLDYPFVGHSVMTCMYFR